MNAPEQLPLADGPIAAYSPTAAALAELSHRFKGVVFDVSTTKGDKEARGFRKELVSLRTGLEAKRRELKAPALAYAKRIDDEAKAITGQILELEEPLDAQIKAEEQRKELERLARVEAEAKRVKSIQDRITRDITGATHGAVGRSFADISQILSDVGSMVIGSEFDEFQGQAQLAKDDALDKLREMQADARHREEDAARLKAEQEAEQARLAAEREELSRLRAEQAERERAAAAAQAEQERKAREARAAEEKAQAEKLAAERAAQEAELRAQREAHEREMAAQRDAQAKADAEARAAREAEEQRLAEERAELRRQQEEAEAARRAEEEAQHAAEKRLRDAAPAMKAALVSLVDQITAPANAEHTLEAFARGAAVVQAREAISSL